MHNLLQTGHTKLELETSQIDLNQEFLPRGTIIGEHTSNRKGTTMTDAEIFAQNSSSIDVSIGPFFR